MKITIAQIEAFYWTATFNSVEKAANTLNIAQPTISLRLRGLEDAVGYQPLSKVGRRLRLTLRGQTLYDECRSILASLERIEDRPDKKRISGPIRIGFAEGFAMICLPQILARLHDDFPDLQPELMIATTAEIEPTLHELQLDLAFLVQPKEREAFRLVHLGAQQASWVSAKQSKLPAFVRPRDLQMLPIISNPVGSINYQQMMGWFASEGLKPKRIDFCNSVSMLAELVTSGVGIGIIPNKLAERYTAQLAAQILVSDPPIANTPVFAKFHVDRHKAKIDAVLRTVTTVLDEMDYLT